MSYFTAPTCLNLYLYMALSLLLLWISSVHLEKANTSPCALESISSHLLKDITPVIILFLSCIINFLLLCNAHKHTNVLLSLLLSQKQKFLLHTLSPPATIPNPLPLLSQLICRKESWLTKLVLYIFGTGKKTYVLFQTHTNQTFAPTTAMKLLFSRPKVASMLLSTMDVSQS